MADWVSQGYPDLLTGSAGVGWGHERRFSLFCNRSALLPKSRHLSGQRRAPLGADFVAKVIDGLGEQ
jgi:hypothetical protein